MYTAAIENIYPDIKTATELLIFLFCDKSQFIYVSRCFEPDLNPQIKHILIVLFIYSVTVGTGHTLYSEITCIFLKSSQYLFQ